MGNDLIAKIVLFKEEIVHLYQGGVLSVKIKGKEGDASVELSCGEIPERKGTRIRFKTTEAEWSNVFFTWREVPISCILLR